MVGTRGARGKAVDRRAVMVGATSKGGARRIDFKRTRNPQRVLRKRVLWHLIYFSEIR